MQCENNDESVLVLATFEYRSAETEVYIVVTGFQFTEPETIMEKLEPGIWYVHELN